MKKFLLVCLLSISFLSLGLFACTAGNKSSVEADIPEGTICISKKFVNDTEIKYCKTLQEAFDYAPRGAFEKQVDYSITLLKDINTPDVTVNVPYEYFFRIVGNHTINCNLLLEKDARVTFAKEVKYQGNIIMQNLRITEGENKGMYSSSTLVFEEKTQLDPGITIRYDGHPDKEPNGFPVRIRELKSSLSPEIFSKEVDGIAYGMYNFKEDGKAVTGIGLIRDRIKKLTLGNIFKGMDTEIVKGEWYLLAGEGKYLEEIAFEGSIKEIHRIFSCGPTDNIKKVTFGPSLEIFPAFNGNLQNPELELDFSRCVNLKEFEKDAFALTKVKKLDFSMCTKVIELPEYLFDQCPELQEVILPPNVETIRDSIFYQSPKINLIVMGNKVKVLENNFIDGQCKEIEYINFNGTINEWYTITKDPGWNHAPNLKAIICTDGRIIDPE